MRGRGDCTDLRRRGISLSGRPVLTAANFDRLKLGAEPQQQNVLRVGEADKR
jgi:hypothetical protein